MTMNQKAPKVAWGNMDPKESKKNTGGVGSPLGMSYASVALEGRKTGLDATINREQRLQA